jgi:two-component system chemotaxis response regulator CheY
MSGPRILVADDDAGARELLASILRAGGFADIVQAGDGPRALALLRDGGRFDCAFLDIEMPGFSGIEVMTMAKVAQPACRWVLVTAHSAIDNVLAGLSAGASGFIVKPYSMNKIFDVMARHGPKGV